MRLWPRRKVYVDDLPRTHDLRFAALFVLVFALVLGSLYALGHVLVGDRLPPGTTVAGVDVGGMTSGQARTVLRSELVPLIEEPVKAKAAGRTFMLDPQETGLSLDIEATVDEALGGGSWDPRHMLRVLFGGGAVEPVIVVNSAEMRQSLSRVAKSVRREPVDARVTFSGGQPRVHVASEGRRLDRVRAARRLQSALLSRDGAVSLPVAAVDADITTREATRFSSEVADEALSAPVRLRVTDTTVKLSPRIFGPALRAKAVDGRLRLDMHPEVLADRSRRLVASLPQQPVDARIRFRGDSVVIRPSRAGQVFTSADWATAVLDALTRGGEERRAEVPTAQRQPRFTTREARLLKIETPIGRQVVRYDQQVSGDGTLVARDLHRLFLLPGQTVSLRRRIDVDPDSSAASLAASVMFEAAFRAGLTILERTPNPVLPPWTTPGLDATVAGAGTDLLIRNDTPYGVLVRAYVDALRNGIGELHVELWSSPYATVAVSSSAQYNIVEPGVVESGGGRCVPRQGVAGFEIDVHRVMSTGDTSRRAETVHSRYQPLPAIQCR